jgi:hypothetical protein
MLREAEVGLILGTNTAGRAHLSRVYPLPSGGHLRIATEPIRLGDGKAISDDGIVPDIMVQVSPSEEQAYYANAYRVAARNSSPNLSNPGDSSLTNSTRASRRRLNEAELVRLLREGRREEEAITASRKEQDAPEPLINDPVLARAIDLLKGLAVVQQFRGR